MQHAGIQYGQGAANSHQSPPFVHADISQSNNGGGNTTSSLRQFRKKDGLEKNPGTDLSNASIGENNSHIARVPPHNHYPARPNDYYRYQYPDYNSPYKEPTAQVKYSEIAETPPQPLQHVDHLQKHKEPHKDFMDMCNITQQTHMKQNYPDNLARQHSYPPDTAPVHQQYLHKEAQVHPNYKQESQYQQYPQLGKYNMPSQCRKYAPPPPPENDFLAKLQRINPSMARSIMSEHHIRESQNANYPAIDHQNRMYPQNQRYYPIQNNPAYNYHMGQPYNYPSSCNYTRPNHMAQYPNPDRSISPRNLHMPVNYPQKISPNYSQYNPPEYAQHYQHRRASQDYYQQSCRTNPYMPTPHQISPEPNDNRASSGLRHFLENWAEEEGPTEIAPIFKENIRIQHNNEEGGNEQVLVINSSDIPQCIENFSLVPTENGQYLIKSDTLHNSVVRIKETAETNGERTVNLQIVEATPKADCMMAETAPPQEGGDKTNEENPSVPYVENQNVKDCDDETTTPADDDKVEQEAAPQEEKTEETTTTTTTTTTTEDSSEENKENTCEASVIVCNEVSVIKDMPWLGEEQERKTPSIEETEGADELETPQPPIEEKDEDTETNEDSVEIKPELELTLDSPVTTTTRRTQRIFSVDDIINNIGSQSNQSRRNSLQLTKIGDEETIEDQSEKSPPPPSEDKSTEESQSPSPTPPPPQENSEEMEYANAISVEDDSVILEIGGALVQLNINHFNGTKVLSVLPLSESLVIDVNGNYQNCEEADLVQDETPPTEEKPQAEENLQSDKNNEDIEDIGSSECQSEIVIGDDSLDNDVFIDLTVEQETNDKVEVVEEKKEKVEETTKKKERKVCLDDKKKAKESEDERKKSTSKKIKESVKKPPQKVDEVKKDEEQKAVKKKDEEQKVAKKKSEEKSPKDEEVKTEKPTNVSTKAAKKLYEPPVKKKEVKSKNDDKTKPKISKLEETVNKIKSLKEKSAKEDTKTKKPTIKEAPEKKKIVKKVTFNLETEIREITKEEEVDRKKLSLEEYNSRKRKSPPGDRKIMEDTVTSSADFNDRVVEQVERSIANAMRKKSPPKMTDNSWEDDVDSPKTTATTTEKAEVVPKINRCIIDVNEFNIKPIESASTPSPVSSSQFSYHSEDDSLQVYKEVVDSKLNSLNIKIPAAKPKPVDKFSILLERFLNKATLDCNELEKVKKIIEFKRKIEEKQLMYEVRNERDYKDLKLHFKKVPEKGRTRKRFRNLYADDTSDESDSSRSEKGVVGDYSVYQRNSQGVPKLIFKRKSGLPQPFVKLERSQAVELLAKKRKLY